MKITNKAGKGISIFKILVLFLILLGLSIYSVHFKEKAISNYNQEKEKASSTTPYESNLDVSCTSYAEKLIPDKVTLRISKDGYEKGWETRWYYYKEDNPNVQIEIRGMFEQGYKPGQNINKYYGSLSFSLSSPEYSPIAEDGTILEKRTDNFKGRILSIEFIPSSERSQDPYLYRDFKVIQKVIDSCQGYGSSDSFKNEDVNQPPDCTETCTKLCNDNNMDYLDSSLSDKNTCKCTCKKR